MIKKNTLHTRFLKAFEVANSMDDVLIPIDIRLQFYAYYKQATVSSSAFYSSNDPDQLRNAFKMNAMLQVRDLSIDDAKLAYIELVNNTIKKYNIDIEFI